MNKYKCVCGASFNDIGDARDHEDSCPAMIEALKQKEQWQNHEIAVNDGDNAIKDVFRPDYEKTRDLEAGKMWLTRWHRHVINKMNYRLEEMGNLQNGTNFIKRRLIVTGLGVINEKMRKEIKELNEAFVQNLEDYDRRIMQKLERTISIGDSDGKKSMIYLTETTFARVRKLGQIFYLTNDTVERMAFAYSIVQLKDFFTESVIIEAKEDITDFEEHIEKLCKPVNL